MLKEQKDLINKRKIAFIYLMHRMFGGSPALMLKVMKFKDVKVGDLEDWDVDFKEAVYKVIEEEDAKGVPMKDPNADVPSIKSLKEKILRQADKVIAETSDPARLASAYKVLSEFENADDRKEQGVLDAINDIVRKGPGRPRKEGKTLLEKARESVHAQDPKEDEDENGEE